MVSYYIGLTLHALGATTDEYGNVLADLFWTVGINEAIDKLFAGESLFMVGLT